MDDEARRRRLVAAGIAGLVVLLLVAGGLLAFGAKYREFTRDLRRRHNGFKLFYHEDVNLMSPQRVLRLRPQPELVVYE